MRVAYKIVTFSPSQGQNAFAYSADQQARINNLHWQLIGGDHEFREYQSAFSYQHGLYYEQHQLQVQGGYESLPVPISLNQKKIRQRKWTKKVQDEKKAARRPFLHNKVWKHSQEWKECYKYTSEHQSLATIHEETYGQQFGLEFISSGSFAVDALAKFAGVEVPDFILREVEGICLLLLNLTQQSTPLGVISSILMWAQGRTSKSLFKTVKDFIEELLVVPQSNVTPDWLECLRDMKQNWDLCKGNRAFKQISKLLGCLVMLGLCDVSKVTFEVGQFKLFAPDLCEKHNTAFDIADAIFETVVFFTEGAYLCFQSGSIRPLLINDRSAMELDQEYAQIMAWYELVRNGNLKKFAEITDAEFENRLNRLSTSLRNLSQSLKGLDKKLVMDKYQRVLNVQNDYVAMKVASGVRHSPWAIELFGESSQGKTTLGDQLIDAVLASQNMPTERQYRCAYNPGDKFMSNWTSDKLVMIFDDVANDKSGFIEKPPTRAIIDVVNNQMYYAPKAELEAKGKCFVEPWIAMATTNKKNLDAATYSNCPYSIQRRMVCITVRAKEEFQRVEDGILCGIDSRKVRDHYTVDGVYQPPVFDDIWNVDIEKAVKPSELHLVAEYQPITWRGKKMTNVSMSECIQWAIEDFDNHKKNQDALLESMRQRECVMKRCTHPGCIHLHGNCPDHPEPYCEPVDTQFGKETVHAITKLWYRADDARKTTVDRVYDRLDGDAANLIYNNGVKFLTSWNWVKFVPQEWMEHEYAQTIAKYVYKDRLLDDYRYESRRLQLTLVLTLLMLWTVLPFVLFIWFSLAAVSAYVVAARHLVERVETNLYERLRVQNMQISPMLKRYRDEYAKYICGACIGIAALYGLARAYRAYKKNESQLQGSLEPKTIEDVAQRDNEVNVWTGVTQRELPITEISKRMNAEQLSNAVEKALLYGTITHEGGNGMMNVLMLSSNVMLVPAHYFDEFGDLLECTFRKKDPENAGGKFACRLHKKFSYLVPGTDLRMCYTPNGGSFKNLVNFFPTGDMPSVPFRMFWRAKNGEVTIAKGRNQPGIVTTYMSFPGGNYANLSINTFGGLCGATLVSETQGSVILGMHLGGIADTPKGCYGTLTQQQLFAGFEHLRSLEGVVLTGEAGVFKTEVLGVQILKNEPLHPRSPLNYMPHDSQVEYLGSCRGRTVTKTDVRVTPISKHIEDVCGVKNIYRGPKLNPDWYGWQECLGNLAVPAHPYDPALLEIAVKDYKEPLVELFKTQLWKDTKPLTDHENLCGIPGKKFMDAIKLNTSVGFPLTGPKRDHIKELEPTEEWPCNRELEQELMDEIHRIEECYKRGERGYTIAKACKKDEILAKDKCRIFYGNPLSLTFLIRKYFLPILRVFQMNPLLAECAVGINSHGPEWERFYKFVTKHGMKRLVGGDYGKYDQKLPAQLILAALRVLIDCAKVCEGYTEQDIRVMEAMCGDIVYAYIAYNGDLIGLTEGTHISGNSLTVIINGICGSLNMRCYFYSQNPCTSFETRLVFRDYVSVMTYGDDNIGSVSSKISNFTVKGFSEFLRKYGQVYTMPDKESELADFIDEKDFEFLKRTSVYHPKLGVHVGALLDKSIYKSLHCFMRPKGTPLTAEEACAQNVDGALREWFNHGEEKFEQQRSLMKEVVARAGISHICSTLEKNYNERCAEWLDQYVSAE